MSATRILMFMGCLYGGLAVALGAFGAHGLKARLPDTALRMFETGVHYQMFHALAIFAAIWLTDRLGSHLALTAGWLFAAGIMLFSGSLYLLATRSLLGIENWTWLGPVTPMGGLCFLAGWVALAIAALK